MATVRLLFTEDGQVRAAGLHDLLFHQAATAWLDVEADSPALLVDKTADLFGLDAASDSRDVGLLALGCRATAAAAAHVGEDLTASIIDLYWTTEDLDGTPEDIRVFVEAFTRAFGLEHGARLRLSLHL